MKPDKEKVAGRLKEIRSSLNLTISEFGDKIGKIPKGTVNSWLRGLALPPKEKLERIAILSNTTSSWILWGKESSEECLSCYSFLSHGECLNCLTKREEEIVNFIDMVDSKLFPMRDERKSLILQITSFELDEIRAKLDRIT